ncbi:ATP-grasp domain-containing protein [Anaerococcus tetradius]|uniref:ATP-grasp domain protein n=1 Tax=Anaerococcus tetradius ATCC 35098 TaxID=525255 RepID=C2CI24_9FIRM|nr:ATP-grasp domain-containing protein [Anaerococcus tetradius]EEI82819.1 ATP-grasp domain protein [Anaerococcus tetradius ATCC 35098]
MNILFCSVGRRCELLKNFKQSLGNKSKIVATDMSKTAPAIYFADKYYIVPPIAEEGYIDKILKICQAEKIDVITTLIDPEIKLLSENRDRFNDIGVLVLAPDLNTANIFFDKYRTYLELKKLGINTVLTYDSIDNFKIGFKNKEIKFPVFVKPRQGSGSVGARKITNFKDLEEALKEDQSLIVQEFMGDFEDIDCDAYFDIISKKLVSIFSKKKLETKIGGASKTISFKDENLYAFLENALSNFTFNGPIDVDLWYKDGEYYLSEINPRFGGAYLHAYGAGVDFIKMIENNVKKIENNKSDLVYEEDIVMMMYDSVVIKKISL